MTRAAAKWSDVQIDPLTRRRVRGSVDVYEDGCIEIRLPHRLESPNKMLHANWRQRTSDKQAWHARLLSAIADSVSESVPALASRDGGPYEALIAAFGLMPVRDRRKVTIERQVPSSRNFIRDRENLVYSCKHLMDQIRRAGFVRDDSMKWIDLDVTQRVSDDKRDWTVIRIELPPGVPMVSPSGVRVKETRERWNQ